MRVNRTSQQQDMAVWTTNLSCFPLTANVMESWADEGSKIPRSILLKGYSNWVEGYIHDVEGKNIVFRLSCEASFSLACCICGGTRVRGSEICVMDYAKYGSLYSKGLKYLIT